MACLPTHKGWIGNFSAVSILRFRTEGALHLARAKAQKKEPPCGKPSDSKSNIINVCLLKRFYLKPFNKFV